MTDGPFIARTDPVAWNEHMAELCDKAAAAHASELSTATDSAMREHHADRARHQKEQAEWHRQEAARLRAKLP